VTKETNCAAGADHVIVTEEEDLVGRVKAITNGAGARLIFDPIAGPLLEKLAEAAAQGAMIIEYGWLSLTPTPFPVVPALTKALNIRGYWLTETVYNPETFARAKKYVYDRIKGVTFDPELPKPSASSMSSKRTNTWNQPSRSERSC
jgi:NADPH:quinone reductase-like Zn-dependent oxidoreductase